MVTSSSRQLRWENSLVLDVSVFHVLYIPCVRKSYRFCLQNFFKVCPHCSVPLPHLHCLNFLPKIFRWPFLWAYTVTLWLRFHEFQAWAYPESGLHPQSRAGNFFPRGKLRLQDRETGFGAKLERRGWCIVRVSAPLSGPRYIFLGQEQLPWATHFCSLWHWVTTLSICTEKTQCTSVTMLLMPHLVFLGVVNMYFSHTAFKGHMHILLITISPVTGGLSNPAAWIRVQLNYEFEQLLKRSVL